MNKFNLLQRDIDILFQSQKELYSKIELLDHSMKILQSFEGLLISDNYANDASSNIRRTYSCNIFLEKNSYFLLKREQLIDKYIRPYIGIKYIRTGEILWYPMGTFGVTSGSFTFDESNRTMSLSCEDLMCCLNGDLNGNIHDRKIKILAEENIRTAIINVLNEAGIEIYNICEIQRTVPYDLEYSETTYYEILKALVELYTGYEMFFNINGVFTVQQIQIKQDDNIIINDEIIQPLLISDNGSFSFTDIYNHVIVYGMEIETDRDLDSCIFNNNIYSATISNLTSYENFTTYSVKLPCECNNGSKLSFNTLDAKNIVTDDNVLIKAGELKEGTYSFRYRRLSDDFLLLGQYQCQGEAYCIDNNNPYSMDNLGYEVCKTINEDKIYSDDLCKQRAQYEVYLSTNLADKLDLSMINIPWLDVNKKIEYTSPNTQQTNIYIIQSINGSTTEATMTINLIKYYKDYSEVYSD